MCCQKCKKSAGLSSSYLIIIGSSCKVWNRQNNCNLFKLTKRAKCPRLTDGPIIEKLRFKKHISYQSTNHIFISVFQFVISLTRVCLLAKDIGRFKIIIFSKWLIQGEEGEGHSTVNYTDTQSFSLVSFISLGSKQHLTNFFTNDFNLQRVIFMFIF